MNNALSQYNKENHEAESRLTRYKGQRIHFLPMSKIVTLKGTFTSEHLREIANVLEEREKAARELGG
jgi:hypothetical protein